MSPSGFASQSMTMRILAAAERAAWAAASGLPEAVRMASAPIFPPQAWWMSMASSSDSTTAHVASSGATPMGASRSGAE